MILQINRIPILIFIFLFVYMPLVVLPFNILHILSVFTLFYLLSRHQGDFLKVIFSRELGIFLLLNILLAFYSLVLSAVTTNDFTATYYAVTTVVEVVPCAIFIAFVLIKMKINLYKFYDLVLFVGMLQVLIVVICIISPEIRNAIIQSANSVSLLDVMDIAGTYRVYGLTRNYTFAMPLFMGLCVIISFVMAKYKSTKYYILIPFFVLAILVNARIGLVGVIIAPLMIFFYRFKRHFIGELLGLTLILSGIFFMLYLVREISYESSSIGTWAWWIQLGVDEVFDFVSSGTTSGNIDVATTMWFAPTGGDVLFGTGQNVFGAVGKSSDLGYVVNLYYGGIFFSVLLYAAYIFLILRVNDKDKLEKIIHMTLLIYLLLVNIKGNVFRPNEIINATIMITTFSIVLRKVQAGLILKKWRIN